MHRPALLIIILLLGSQGCGPDTNGGSKIPINATLEITLGTSQFIGDTGVEVGFARIYGDYRCPWLALCIWAGTVEIDVWIKAPDQDTVHFEPVLYGHVALSDSDHHQTVLSDRFSITLQQLNPYPMESTDGNAVDTAATIVVKEMADPLSQSRIKMVDQAQYAQYDRNNVDQFYIDSVAITNDSLLIYVRYSGGCNNHDFYTFGSLAWGAGQPPVMPVTIVHMGHRDSCEAFLARTLRIDLTPVTQLTGYGNEALIKIGPNSQGIYYAW